MQHNLQKRRMAAWCYHNWNGHRTASICRQINGGDNNQHQETEDDQNANICDGWSERDAAGDDQLGLKLGIICRYIY